MPNFNDTFLPKLQKGFNVIFPNTNFATYKSLVNYASDLDKPIQKWYRYKEGYSIKLVDEILVKYWVKDNDLIVDPFCWSGSTLLKAKMRNCNSIWFEINPFSAFLAKTKTQDYSDSDYNNFCTTLDIFQKIKRCEQVNVPKLSTINKLFDKDALDYLLTLKSNIENIEPGKVADLFRLAWLGILEDGSNYRKAGNGLKIRNTIKKVFRDEDFIKTIFFKALNWIKEDLKFSISLSWKVNTSIVEDSCLNLDNYIENDSIKWVIFSPPYANCFDYTEIYKVELWMGWFVQDYPDLKILRKKGIRSHLNGYEIETKLAVESVPELWILVQELSQKELWDKRIPKMVEAYFNDMFLSISKIYAWLKKGGFCVIIVSNSAYWGVIVPTDLLLAKYARGLGFNVSSIEVARYIITSSQQYKETEKYRPYLRESIIYLEKQ
jgi:DNA modification methylase